MNNTITALILYFIGGAIYVWYHLRYCWNDIAKVIQEEPIEELSEEQKRILQATAVILACTIAFITWPIDVLMDLFKYKVLSKKRYVEKEDS